MTLFISIDKDWNMPDAPKKKKVKKTPGEKKEKKAPGRPRVKPLGR